VDGVFCSPQLRCSRYNSHLKGYAMRRIYLVASVLGFILPVGMLIYFNMSGFTLPIILSEVTSNQAALLLFTDLVISSLVFWAFLFHEGRRLNIRHLWVYVFLNLFVGLSLALPLFLYSRENQLRYLQRAKIYT
jgi:hypothetical protein